MPIPHAIDQQIRKRFAELITEAQKFAEEVAATIEANLSKIERWSGDRYARGPGPRTDALNETLFYSLRTRSLSLIELISIPSGNLTQISLEIRSYQSPEDIKKLLGILQGLQSDYETGMLEPLISLMEANISGDYLGQAERLLGEGGSGQFNHVPAAVLAGAVLEDAFRRLCQRQIPPIETDKANGDPKKMTVMIDDLKMAGLYNEVKAKQLRSWADIRNAAAHGRFNEFNRQDVEVLLSGVETFLADYL